MKKSKLFGFALAILSVFSLSSCNSKPIVGPQGEQGIQGEPGQDGVSIISIDCTGHDGLTDIYTITYSDGTTSTFVVTNGKDGEQGIQGVPGEDGHTPIITISSDGYWVVDGVKSNTKAQGDKGEPGKDGTSLLTGNGEPSVDLGKNGDSFIDLDTWNYYVKTDGNWIHVGNIKGEQGNQGADGENGNGIVSIELTSSEGNADTYTITFDNGETITFTVTNGKDGEQGIQGEPGEDGHTPVITIGENGNWYIDGEDTGVLAEGIQGEQGEPGKDGTDGNDGLSAYEIYIKYHPEYTGTEEEWLEDLVNGDLREDYTVTFNSNGGSAVEPQKVKYGRLAMKPQDDPTRTGYLFDGWYLNGEPFPFNTYQIYDDITLQAHWKEMNINLTLDANGGEVEYNTKVVTYGVSYVLPTPTRENYTFDGWYYEDTTLCPQSGTWTFSKDDITLKARWAGTQAEITFASDENIQVDSSSITIAYGDDYTLPVPPILTGDKFIGWADTSGELVTDETGKSLKPSEFKTNTELHAVYYVPVTTPNQLLNLCTAEANDERLTRTYVLQNDLDFTGLANESIYNFTGIFDGNGYDIIGLEKPLFGSVGRSDVTCTDDIEVKNVNLVNFSAESFVDQVLGCETFTIDSVTIESFVKDESNYCATYGIVKTIGYGTTIKAPTNFYMNNCHINDEFATIESGLIDYLAFSYQSILILNCSIRSNTKKSAFISGDYYEEQSTSLRGKFGIDETKTVEIAYCTNFGCTNSLVSMSSGSCYYKGMSDLNYRTFSCSLNLRMSNCINFGKIINLYKNVLNSSLLLESNEDGNSYARFTAKKTIIKKCLNFGAIESFISAVEKESYSGANFGNTFYLDSCFNAGITANSSFQFAGDLINNYQFTPLTGIEDPGAFSVTNYSQINSDFFINTIGLDPERWNLSYINIQDEYGLPTIIYNN